MGTVCGQVFRPRERALETTFRPDRAPVSGTITGHSLGLNSIFPPRRTWQKIRDDSVRGTARLDNRLCPFADQLIGLPTNRAWISSTTSCAFIEAK